MTQLEELLATWIPRQRWFAGKGAPIESVTVESEHPIVTGDPALRLLVVRVRQHSTASRYQILLGTCPGDALPAELTHAEIGVCTPPGLDSIHTVYDAAHDPALTMRLLDRIARGTGGSLRFQPVPGSVVRTGLRSLVLSAEQSNTSVVYGEEYVLKIFRRLWPGHNPDLELNAALSGSPFVSPPHGWIETDLDDEQGRSIPTTLAMLQKYLRSATDGWVLAATSVRDLYDTPNTPPGAAGGDFAGEAERLGAATAAVHRHLARALATDVLSSRALREVARSMEERLRRAVTEVPQLRSYAGPLRAAFKAFAEIDDPLPVQRVHGDYHLGQVVRTDTGWVLLDFEGEPGAPIDERQRLSSPLRDVAGMLRSFDYAARYQLVGNAHEKDLAPVARDWARHNRDAFCAGYANGGGVDPEKQRTVLRAFEYDKAVYEVLYEARNRPTWLRIPLDSIAALATTMPHPSRAMSRATTTAT